jgi:FkbM family methyltransferase
MKTFFLKAISPFPLLHKTIIFRKLIFHFLYNKNKISDYNEIKFIKSKVDFNSVFLDVGANTGIYSYALSQVISSKNLYMFEPQIDLYKNLLNFFKKSNVHNIALSNMNSLVEFKIPYINNKKYKTRGTLRVNFVEENETNFKKIYVRSEKLDDFVLKNNINKIDFIKIDVEGFEEEVIEGAQETIIKLKPKLMIEIEQRHHKKNINLVINKICKFGYECFFIDLYGNVKYFSKISDNELSVNLPSNFFFFPS